MSRAEKFLGWNCFKDWRFWPLSIGTGFALALVGDFPDSWHRTLEAAVIGLSLSISWNLGRDSRCAM